MATNRIVLTLEIKDSGAIRVLKDASKGLEHLGKDAAEADKKLGRVEDTINGTGAAGRKAKKELGLMGKAFKGMGVKVLVANQALQFTRTLLGPLIRGMGEFITEGAAFEQRLRNIATLLDEDVGVSMEKFRQGIHDLLLEVPSDADELGAAAYQIVSAGISGTADALNVLRTSSKLGIAGLSTTAEAADVMTSALNAFEISADDANRVANVLFLTVKKGKTTIAEIATQFGSVAAGAAKVGVTFEELQAATAAITVTGVATSQAQTALAQLMLSLLNPSETLIQLFGRLNEAEGKNIRSGSDLIEVYGGLRGALDAIERASGGDEQIITKAFKRAQATQVAFALLGAQRGTFGDTLRAMAEDSTAFEVAFAKAAESTEKKIQLMKGAFFVLRDVLFQELTPSIQAMTEGVQGFVTEAIESGKVERWAEGVRGAVEGLAEAGKYLARHWENVVGAIKLVLLLKAVKWLAGAQTATMTLMAAIVKLTTKVKAFGAAWTLAWTAGPALPAAAAAVAGAVPVVAGMALMAGAIVAAREGIRQQRRAARNRLEVEMAHRRDARRENLKQTLLPEEAEFVQRGIGARRAKGRANIAAGIAPPENLQIVGLPQGLSRADVDALNKVLKSRVELMTTLSEKSSLLLQTATAELALRRSELTLAEKTGASESVIATARSRVVEASKAVLRVRIDEVTQQRDIIANAAEQNEFDALRLDVLNAQLVTMEHQLTNADALARRKPPKSPKDPTGAEDLPPGPLDSWAASALETAELIEGAWAQTFDGIARGITEMAISGKADFASLAQSILAMIIEIQVRAALAGLFKLIGWGGVGGGEILPAGNDARVMTIPDTTSALGIDLGDQAAAQQWVPPRQELVMPSELPKISFEALPELPKLGFEDPPTLPTVEFAPPALAALQFAASGVPTVATAPVFAPTVATGPNIMPVPQAAAGGGAGAPVSVNVNVTTPSGTSTSVQQNRRQGGGLDLDILVEQVEGAMALSVGTGGGLAPTLEGQYGLNRVRGASR